MELDQYAYNLKYFNFNALQVSAEREYLVREVARKVVGHAIKQIGTPATSSLLEAQKETVVECIVKSCSNKIKCLRDLDSKVFRIPSHVLQFQDIRLSHQYTSEDEEQRLVTLEALKARYRENMGMQARLFLEEKKYEDMEDIINEEMEFQSRIHEARNLYNLSKLPKFFSQISVEGKDIRSKSGDLPPFN
ncbi:uncharacterized protein Mis12 [Drosophila bipectinata]|uniref:uncharacterized protein Mis12 n=1 Tax=Drosophila bipectinata TaxID=42026 RepID=UPI001C89077C|nr:uncharacterized protein LOC108131222 [Drosophila bipectinata]